MKATPRSRAEYYQPPEPQVPSHHTAEYRGEDEQGRNFLNEPRTTFPLILTYLLTYSMEQSPS